VAAKRFDFTPIPQAVAPARDRVLTASPDGSQPLAGARLVPLDLLVSDPDQPRKTFDDGSLQELAESLRTAGVRQPISAFYDDKIERFVVVSGERRMLAARLAGLTHVPALVDHRPTSDAAKLVLQLTENLVREDLTVPDAAHALARLRELLPLEWLEVARRHGIGRRRAYQYLEHLKDPPVLQEALIQGSITEGHAEELRRVPKGRLEAVLADVVVNGLSVADTRRFIAESRGDWSLGGTAVADAGGSMPVLPGLPELGAAAPQPEVADSLGRGAQAQPREGSAPASADGPVADVPSEQALAGEVADVMTAAAEPGSSGAARLRVARSRRERSRRLRLRLERIDAELRNVHVEEVTTDLDQLPEIIAQARETRVGLDRFIALLERVQLDKAGSMEHAAQGKV